MKETGVGLSDLGYFDNMLVADPAAAMYALRHEVFQSQGIPIQGVGREAHRS